MLPSSSSHSSLASSAFVAPFTASSPTSNVTPSTSYTSSMVGSDSSSPENAAQMSNPHLYLPVSIGTVTSDYLMAGLAEAKDMLIERSDKREVEVKKGGLQLSQFELREDLKVLLCVGGVTNPWRGSQDGYFNPMHIMSAAPLLYVHPSSSAATFGSNTMRTVMYGEVWVDILRDAVAYDILPYASTSIDAEYEYSSPSCSDAFDSSSSLNDLISHLARLCVSVCVYAATVSGKQEEIDIITGDYIPIAEDDEEDDQEGSAGAENDEADLKETMGTGAGIDTFNDIQAPNSVVTSPAAIQTTAATASPSIAGPHMHQAPMGGLVPVGPPSFSITDVAITLGGTGLTGGEFLDSVAEGDEDESMEGV